MKLPIAAVSTCACLIAVTATPVARGSQDAAGVRYVASAPESVVVVKHDGSVVEWTRPAARPMPVVLPQPAVQVAAGYTTSYALLQDGGVMAWGANIAGQLGTGVEPAPGRNAPPSPTPVKVAGLGDIVQVQAGDRFALALRRDGVVFAWGRRADGALGDGQTGNRPAFAPVQVRGVPSVARIAAGPSHALAMTTDGRVFVWGSNRYGQLGVDRLETIWEPTAIPNFDRVVAIAAGFDASGAVRADGTVWMWGSNRSAMIGNGQRAGAYDEPGGIVPRPTPVKGVTRAKDIAIGAGHVMALADDGSIRSWGFDGYGQVGVGTSGGYYPSPRRMTGAAKIAAIYAGGYRSFAVAADGTLLRWGFQLYAAGVRQDAKAPVPLLVP